MAQTQANIRTKTVRITKDQWFDQVINLDGGASLIEKLGFEAQNRKMQGEDKKISFICKNGTYIFTKWNESGASGNAIRFFQHIYNISDWTQTVQAISDFLGIESYIYSKNNDHSVNHHSVNFSQKIVRKATKKEKIAQQAKFTILDYSVQFKDTFTKEELNYWAKKTSCTNIGLLTLILLHHGIKSVKSGQITIKYENNDIPKTQKFDNLKCVFAIETLAGINEYRIIQPNYQLGAGYYLWTNKNKRFFFPSLEKTKKAEPNYQFSMGLDSPKDLTKPTILASGESDYLTLILQGYQAVCLGGEGQKFNEYSLAIMRKNGYSTKNLSILFDNDSNKKDFNREKDKNTGLEFAKKLSAEYKIPYLLIPNFKNSDIKDVSDFFAAGFDKGDNNKESFEKFVLNLPNFETSLKSQRIFTKEKYFANDRYLVETIKNLIKSKSPKNRFILIDSAAGSGKTDFFLNKEGNFWNDPEIQKIFDSSIYAVPTITLAKQMSKKYETEALYGGKQVKNLTDKIRVVTTFDSFQKVDFDVKLVHIDEFHMLSGDLSYRKKAMKWLFNLPKLYPNAVFVFTTATPSKFLNKAWEKVHGKITHIRIDSPQKANYKVYDSSFAQGIKNKDKKNVLLEAIKNNYDQNKTTIVHINSKSQIEKCIEKLVAQGVPRQEMDYFISHKWNMTTKAMDSIIKKELLPQKTKILFCTNAIVQGLNINNEGEFDLFVYSNGNHRISTKNFIQLCNRFRKAKVNVMLMNSEFEKERDPLGKQIESDKKRLTAEQIVRDLNNLKNDDFIKLSDKVNKVRETFDHHALDMDLEKIGDKFSISELYFAAEQESIEESCYATENYLNQIVKTGRGIVWDKDFDKISFQTLPTIQTEVQNQVIDASIKRGKEELRENICQELGNDPQPLLKVVLENTKNDTLKKKANYFLLGADLENIPNTKVNFNENSPSDVDMIENYVSNFLYFLDLSQKNYQEVADIVFSCDTPRALKKQKQFFALRNMHKEKEQSTDYLSDLDLKNIKAFQQVAKDLIGTETKIKNRTLFYEDLYCKTRYTIFAGRKFTRYDCRDLFDNLFELTKKVTRHKDEKTGKQARQYLIENVKAFFEW